MRWNRGCASIGNRDNSSKEDWVLRDLNLLPTVSEGDILGVAMKWVKQKCNILLACVVCLFVCALSYPPVNFIAFMSNQKGGGSWYWIDSIGFFVLLLPVITLIVQILMLVTPQASRRPPIRWLSADSFHFLYMLILLMFINLLCRYDHTARELLKTEKRAQENADIFRTILSFFDDFIGISALIIVIEVVVVILAARTILTDGNSHWFVRTYFYLAFGFIFTSVAYLMVLTVRPLKQLAEIPIGHKTLWWLITGCLAVLIYTYSKQVFDERICPKNEETAPTKSTIDLS